MTTEKRITEGQFHKGSSGNPSGRPPGSRNKTTLLCEQLLEGEAEELIRPLVTKARRLYGPPSIDSRAYRLLGNHSFFFLPPVKCFKSYCPFLRAPSQNHSRPNSWASGNVCIRRPLLLTLFNPIAHRFDRKPLSSWDFSVE
jgi:hypothetical protein